MISVAFDGWGGNISQDPWHPPPSHLLCCYDNDIIRVKLSGARSHDSKRAADCHPKCFSPQSATFPQNITMSVPRLELGHRCSFPAKLNLPTVIVPNKSGRNSNVKPLQKSSGLLHVTLQISAHLRRTTGRVRFPFSISLLIFWWVALLLKLD